MKYVFTLALTALALSATALGQSSHLVTVYVENIVELTVTGAPTLTITALNATPDTTVTDSLAYKTNRDITVQVAVDHVSSEFGLSVVASNCEHGTMVVTPIELATTAANIVTAIEQGSDGNCDLTYAVIDKGVVPLYNGAAGEVFDVTYTFVGL